MSTVLPKRTVRYDSPIIDAARWDGYEPRDDDIFICTPPKCGTTWTQAICALLIFGRADIDVKPGVVSPWLDATHTPIDETIAMLQAQDHQRFIKTHTPLDGIPFFSNCIYLAVFRDPRDVHFSMRNHATNQASGKNAHRATKNVGEGFRRWVGKPYVEGDEDNFSLVSFAHHYKTFKEFAHLPNVHLFHYADLKRDLRGSMEQISNVLGISHTGAAMDELASTASFENMKKRADQFVPGAGQGRWKDEGRFFNKGANNQWRGVLSDDDMAVYAARMGELFSGEDIAWLQHGSEGVAAKISRGDESSS